MRRVNATAVLAMLGCCAAPAQSPPAFEVASVKRSKEPNSGGYRHQITPDSLTMLHVSLGYCIRLAYGMWRPYDLAGPAWIDPPTDVLVDIVAKTGKPVAEPPVPRESADIEVSREDQIRLMLQTLLADRFKLAVHREKRNLPAYEQLRAAPGRCGRRDEGPAGDEALRDALPKLLDGATRATTRSSLDVASGGR